MLDLYGTSAMLTFPQLVFELIVLRATLTFPIHVKAILALSLARCRLWGIKQKKPWSGIVSVS